MKKLLLTFCILHSAFCISSPAATKFSELPNSGVVTSSTGAIVPIVNGTTNYKITLPDLATSLLSGSNTFGTLSGSNLTLTGTLNASGTSVVNFGDYDGGTGMQWNGTALLTSTNGTGFTPDGAGYFTNLTIFSGGTLDLTGATVAGFSPDLPLSLSGSSTSVVLENELGNSTTFSMGRHPEDTTNRWTIAAFGIGLAATQIGNFEANDQWANSYGGFGFGMERGWTTSDGDTVNEFYVQDETSNRPFYVGYSRVRTANATITSGTCVLDSPLELFAGDRFQFRGVLSSTATLSTNTWYYAKTRISATAFTISTSANGAVISTGTTPITGTFYRGGLGGSYFTTNLTVTAPDDMMNPSYNNNPTSTSLLIDGTSNTYPTRVMIRNYGGTAGSQLQFYDQATGNTLTLGYNSRYNTAKGAFDFDNGIAGVGDIGCLANNEHGAIIIGGFSSDATASSGSAGDIFIRISGTTYKAVPAVISGTTYLRLE